MAQLVDYEIPELSLVGKPANERGPLLFKSEEDAVPVEIQKEADRLTQLLLQTTTDGEEELNDVLRSAGVDEAARNSVIGAARLLASHLDQIDKSERETIAENVLAISASGEEDDEEENLPPKAAKRLEKLEKDRERRMREAKRDYVEREFDRLPVDKDSLADALFEVEQELGEDVADSFEEQLKALNAQAAEAMLFRTVGSDARDGGGGEAMQEIEEKVETVKEEQGLSDHEALQKVVDDNPDLAARYYQEQ